MYILHHYLSIYAKKKVCQKAQYQFLYLIMKKNYWNSRSRKPYFFSVLNWSRDNSYITKSKLYHFMDLWNHFPCKLKCSIDIWLKFTVISLHFSEYLQIFDIFDNFFFPFMQKRFGIKRLNIISSSCVDFSWPGVQQVYGLKPWTQRVS